ncbi:MAG: 50S ribosomal protein L19, partial [Patescibacteria group bacterium]
EEQLMIEFFYNRIKEFNAKNMKKVPNVKSGDTVRVHTKIKEGSKERIQIFEGVVIKKQGGDNVGATITVRKISYGIGVERTFLLHSPLVEKVQVLKRAHVRRANIGYLRDLTGKSAKLREKQFDALAVNVKEEELAPADQAEIDEPVEISEDVLNQAETVSAEDVAKKEEKEAKTEDTGPIAEDEQEAPEEEIEQGVEKAEKDMEKGKSTEGKLTEKSEEDKEVKEETREKPEK